MVANSDGPRPSANPGTIVPPVTPVNSTRRYSLASYAVSPNTFTGIVASVCPGANTTVPVSATKSSPAVADGVKTVVDTRYDTVTGSFDAPVNATETGLAVVPLSPSTNDDG